MRRVTILAAFGVAALVVCPAGGMCPAGVLYGAPAIEDTTSGTIVVSVLDARDKGVADAPLRLRDVTTGRVHATARSNEAGQFTFRRVAGGAYIVEVVDGEGSILAVGQTFDVMPGDTVATVVRLAGRTRWFAGFFGNAAAAAVASAASLGVTAVAPTGQAVSGVR